MIFILGFSIQALGPENDTLVQAFLEDIGTDYSFRLKIDLRSACFLKVVRTEGHISSFLNLLPRTVGKREFYCPSFFNSKNSGGLLKHPMYHSDYSMVNFGAPEAYHFRKHGKELAVCTQSEINWSRQHHGDGDAPDVEAYLSPWKDLQFRMAAQNGVIKDAPPRPRIREVDKVYPMVIHLCI